MSDFEAKNVLVIEDELKNATLVSVMLRIAGVVSVMMCELGEQVDNALTLMGRVDLILLDLQLPNEDGYQILARLRRRPERLTCPIVAMTAQIMPEDIAHAEAAGFDGFLGKPLNFDRFRGQIRRLLAGERVWEPR